MSTLSKRTPNSAQPIRSRIDEIPWIHVYNSLNSQGNATIDNLLTEPECQSIVNLYEDDSLFRSRIVMARHGYGKGEYKYFDYPLPELVKELRALVYPRLVPIANEWSEAMRIEVRFPENHSDFIDRCHHAGQTRPTPLILQYGADDYNCLHQDLYGEHVFPLQLAILLSKPSEDFEGGEFILTEQRPRMQTRPQVVPLRQGTGVIFAVHQRPVKGTRGSYRVNMRHGVSEIRSGRRHTLGIIFHDAK